jgi:hypothetical protein
LNGTARKRDSSKKRYISPSLVTHGLSLCPSAAGLAGLPFVRRVDKVTDETAYTGLTSRVRRTGSTHERTKARTDGRTVACHVDKEQVRFPEEITCIRFASFTPAVDSVSLASIAQRVSCTHTTAGVELTPRIYVCRFYSTIRSII